MADRIQQLPPGFKSIARTDNAPIAAMQDATGRLYGIQFHPEVTHTPQGLQILQNFLYRVCGCSPSWTMQSFVEPAVAAIRDNVGKSVCSAPLAAASIRASPPCWYAVRSASG